MNIYILSQREAEAYSKRLKDSASIAIISITTKEYGDEKADIKLGGGVKYLLRMRFNDLTEDIAEKDYLLTAPVQEDFTGLKEFIDTINDNVDELWIHCAAGVSRSAGLGAAVCEYLGMDHSIFTSKNFVPNMLVYRLTKNELGINEVEYGEKNGYSRK